MDVDQRSEVDTTSPFRSVKEAVAVFGERFLAGELQSSTKTAYNSTAMAKLQEPETKKPVASPPSLASASSPSFASFSQKERAERDEEADAPVTLMSTVRRLEAELEETKREVMLLRERESEVEVVVASLNAELHKNATRLAEMEESAAKSSGREKGSKSLGSAMSFEYFPTLAEVLNLGEIESEFEEEEERRRRRKEEMRVKKQKPIVPLVGDVFSAKKMKKKGSTSGATTPTGSSDRRQSRSLYSPSISGSLC